MDDNQTITLHVKGSVIAGTVLSFPLHNLRRYQQAKEKHNYQQAIEVLDECIKQQEEELHKIETGEVQPNIIVIENAEIRYGSHNHRTAFWIGDIGSVDGYELTIFGEKEEEEEEEE